MKIHHHKDPSADYCFFWFISIISRSRRGQLSQLVFINQRNLLAASGPVTAAMTHWRPHHNWVIRRIRALAGPPPTLLLVGASWLHGRLSESLLTTLICDGTRLFGPEATQPCGWSWWGDPQVFITRCLVFVSLGLTALFSVRSDGPLVFWIMEIITFEQRASIISEGPVFGPFIWGGRPKGQFGHSSSCKVLLFGLFFCGWTTEFNNGK